MLCKIQFGVSLAVTKGLSHLKPKEYTMQFVLYVSKKITGESFSPAEDELLLLPNSVCSGCYN